MTENPNLKMPTEAEIAESLARAQEAIAMLAAIPPEQRETVVDRKFAGPIGGPDHPEPDQGRPSQD